MPVAVGFDPVVHVQLNTGGIGVTWVSVDEEDGFVDWALSQPDLVGRSGTFARASDEHDSSSDFDGWKNKRTHRVRIIGVQPFGSTIYYNIVSGGRTDPNGPFMATTPSGFLITPPNLITGRVSYDGGAQGNECLVYMRVTQRRSIGGNEFFENSLWVNTLSNGGGYVLDATNIRQDPDNLLSNNFDNALQYGVNSQDANITIYVVCGPGQRGTLSRTTADAEKLIILGSVAEYRRMDVVVAPH